MKIAVLFDGAGLARLGLEQAGHNCTGFELNPKIHELSLQVGSGNCILADARDVNLTNYDAVWASPPCQWLSVARTQGDPTSNFADNLLNWSLAIKNEVLWVENVLNWQKKLTDPVNSWGKRYNAAQFLEEPIQSRVRIIGGRYKEPKTYREFKLKHPGICPTITATEHKGCASDKRRASRFYGRRLTLEECAYHQGFKIPSSWKGTKKLIYEAIGNGVPVYMAKAFGEAFS